MFHDRLIVDWLTGITFFSQFNTCLQKIKKDERLAGSGCIVVMTRLITIEEAHSYVPTSKSHANQP
jgi:hypothetical protein